jgi:hypothetical protein
MVRAKPCICEPALDFERDRCNKCGRWLPHVLAKLELDLTSDPGLERLDAAIEAQRAKWRAEYRIPPDGNYLSWIAANVE